MTHPISVAYLLCDLLAVTSATAPMIITLAVAALASVAGMFA